MSLRRPERLEHRIYTFLFTFPSSHLPSTPQTILFSPINFQLHCLSFVNEELF